MKVEFSLKFSKDLDAITQKKVKANILKAIETLEGAKTWVIFQTSKN